MKFQALPPKNFLNALGIESHILNLSDLIDTSICKGDTKLQVAIARQYKVKRRQVVLACLTLELRYSRVSNQNQLAPFSKLE
jgi:hypothetical protein